MNRGIVSVLVILLLLASCKDQTASKPATISWWHINTDKPGIQAIETIGKEFAARNPGITVVPQPVDNLEYKQKLSLELGAHDPPDVFASWGGGELSEMAKGGLIRDITDWVQSPAWSTKISPAALDIYSWKGRIYGFPQDLGAVGFWYNADLIGQAGYKEFPSTWSGFIGLVKALKSRGITPIALGISDNWPGMYYWVYLSLRISGPGLYKDILDGSRTFEDPAIIKAAGMLLHLVALKPFQKTALSDDFNAESRVMGNGEAAMHLMGQWALAVQEQMADKKDALSGVMRFAPFPAIEGEKGTTGDAMGGANGFVIGRNAPDTAIALLEYFNETANLQRYFDAFPAIPTSKDVKIRDSSLQSVRKYLDHMSSFTFYPDQTFPAHVNKAINEITSKLIVGEFSPVQAAAALQAAWKSAPKP